MKRHDSRKQWLQWNYLLICLILIFAIGCNRANDKNSTQKQDGQPRFLSVGTAPPGGAFFVVGGAIAEVISNHTSEYVWKVSAEATKGTQENIRRLAKGELDLALANAAITYFAVRGEGAWEKEYPIRTVMTLAPNVALFIAKESSDVKTIADLKGKRVVVGPAGAGFEYFLGPILKAHGVSYDDFTPLHNTQAGSVDMIADSSAAAAFLGGAVPTSSITQASASQDIFFIPFEQSARQKLLAEYPFFAPATIPAGIYRGQEEAFEGLNVGSMHLITSADVDDDTIYMVAKTLYESRAEIVQRHPAGKAISPTNIVRDTGTPFHPGAIRYYKEISIWPEETTE